MLCLIVKCKVCNYLIIIIELQITVIIVYLYFCLVAAAVVVDYDDVLLFSFCFCLLLLLLLLFVCLVICSFFSFCSACPFQISLLVQHISNILNLYTCNFLFLYISPRLYNYRNRITCMHRNKNPCNSFLMIKMASGMDDGRVGSTTTTTITTTTTNDVAQHGGHPANTNSCSLGLHRISLILHIHIFNWQLSY